MEKRNSLLVITLAIVGVAALFALKLAAIREGDFFTRWLETLPPTYLANIVVLLLVAAASLVGYVFFLRSEIRNLKDRY